ERTMRNARRKRDRPAPLSARVGVLPVPGTTDSPSATPSRFHWSCPGSTDPNSDHGRQLQRREDRRERTHAAEADGTISRLREATTRRNDRKGLMRATVMYGAGDVRVENVPDPAVREPTDAIVRVVRSCICGSDLWPYHSMPSSQHGRRMGHEFLGIVEDVG